jgi:hypothetical protein
MAVKAYITRDPDGNPWPPVHEHEATAAVGLIQRLHEAVDPEAALYAVFANLQQPSADLVVLTELGLGVMELKHYAGTLSVRDTMWYTDQKLIRAGTQADNPHEQVQTYASRIRGKLVQQLASLWSIDEQHLRDALRVQTAVCFTNPRIRIDPDVRTTIEEQAEQRRRRWETFRLLTPADFAAWASTLRFGMEQDRSAQFAPYRLQSKQIMRLGKTLFTGDEWTEIRNLMPTGQPYAYLVLRQTDQEPQIFPLRATTTTLGRDGGQCQVSVPESYRRVSRMHAKITRVGSIVWIEDVQSTYGTYIDGVPVDEIDQLRPGQRITLGGPDLNERVCALDFCIQLPPDLQARGTAADTSSGRE